jgi:DNA-binding MarR family transcriptional regulator
MTPNETGIGADVDADVERVVAEYELLVHQLAAARGPELIDTSISMAQIKALFVVGVAGELQMSELTARLGVSSSTVSGLVDRLADHGYLTRRDDPADRRHVILAPTAAGLELLDRFRELGASQLRALLEQLTPDELQTVSDAVRILVRAATAHAAPEEGAPADAATTPAPAAEIAHRKDPS